MLRFEVLSFFTLDCRVFWKGALSKVGFSLQCRLGWLLRKADNFWLASCKQAMGEVRSQLLLELFNDLTN